MEPIEIARKLAGYGERAGACKGYETAVAQGLAPEEELEAAIYILQFGGNYKVAYTSFLKLYRQGLYQDMLLPVLTEAFYQPISSGRTSPPLRRCPSGFTPMRTMLISPLT